MRRRLTRTGALVAVAALLSACGLIGGESDGDRVTIEFFQFKPEAIQTFDEVIADFEAENPGIGILTCLWAWNDFILPLVILSSPDAQTLPLVQYIFQGQFNVNYTVAFASYLIALAPLVLVYVLAQRWVISGVMRGAVK